MDEILGESQKCSFCAKISMKSISNKDSSRKARVRLTWKPCRNIYERKGRELDDNHCLIVNIRNRIYKSLEA